MVIRIKRSNSAGQPYYVVIVASNGETLFTSETYHNKSDAMHAARLVIALAGDAEIVDTTTSA